VTKLLPHINTWIFDLDNTLYPATCRLFDQIDKKMGLYIENLLQLDPVAARALQKSYFKSHGTTLRGLMENHHIDPLEFLEFVHGIDLNVVKKDPNLGAALDQLPGRKIIYTNASVSHCDRVLTQLGLTGHFQGIFDIIAANYRPKPDPESYRQFIRLYDIDPATSLYADDLPRNLGPAADLGMTTLWIKTDVEWAQAEPGMHSIHHQTNDLAYWLKQARG